MYRYCCPWYAILCTPHLTGLVAVERVGAAGVSPHVRKRNLARCTLQREPPAKNREIQAYATSCDIGRSTDKNDKILNAHRPQILKPTTSLVGTWPKNEHRSRAYSRRVLHFFHTSIFQLPEKPWSQVSSLLPPGPWLQFFIAHRVQQSHCSSIFMECC